MKINGIKIALGVFSVSLFLSDPLYCAEEKDFVQKYTFEFHARKDDGDHVAPLPEFIFKNRKQYEIMRESLTERFIREIGKEEKGTVRYHSQAYALLRSISDMGLVDGRMFPVLSEHLLDKLIEWPPGIHLMGDDMYPAAYAFVRLPCDYRFFLRAMGQEKDEQRLHVWTWILKDKWSDEEAESLIRNSPTLGKNGGGALVRERILKELQCAIQHGLTHPVPKPDAEGDATVPVRENDN